jgi:pre-mRNA-splicing factor ATP-dependent RNA helicase DHX16
MWSPPVQPKEDDEAARQRELDKDLEERDAFHQRLLEKDKSRTKQTGGTTTTKGMTAEQLRELSTKGTVTKAADVDMEDARIVSRRAYLKKREEKEIAILEKELRDEEYLFGDMPRTQQEMEALELKRKILEMAKAKDRFDDEVKGYRMPESYDEDGGMLDTKRRDAALHTRYQEEEEFKTEQELWEEQQARIATFHAGAKDRKPPTKKAEDAALDEFLFEVRMIDDDHQHQHQHHN